VGDETPVEHSEIGDVEENGSDLDDQNRLEDEEMNVEDEVDEEEEGLIGTGALEIEFDQCRRALLEMVDILDYNRPFYDLRLLSLLRCKLAGLKDLHQRIREKESHVNSTRTTAPRTFNHNTNLVMFIRTHTAVRINAFCNSHDFF
jgi:hypothetical protein